MSNKKNHSGLTDILLTIPEKPGVYRFYSSNSDILYIGKAKNLKKRVNSYFTKSHDSFRLRFMVSQIRNIQFTVVENEKDALLLERNLINNEKPKYNIQFRDDKSYPSIAIKNEPFPRVFFTRKKIDDGSEYFGPYTSVFYARKAFETITKLFPLRTCSLNLTKKNIENKKFKVCLEYHIENCLGPCEGYQSEEEYLNNIEQIRNILQGKSSVAISYLEEKQKEFEDNLAYEKAHDYQKRIETLQDYKRKNNIVDSSINHVDAYHILSVEERSFITYLKIRNGAIVSTFNFQLKHKLDENDAQLLQSLIEKHRSERTENENAPEVIVPIDIDIVDVKITVPKSGDKLKILEIAFRNLISQKQHYFDIKEKQAKKESNVERILLQMQKDLRLTEKPIHIECFDNSNIQGTNPVASMVVFKNAKPSKKDYRHFKIKTVEGPNDFASMEEVVYRRYSRLIKEEKELPNLVIVDGGKGQLSSALKSLEKLNLIGKLPIIGIAKRLEEIYYPGDSLPLYINKKSESLKVIQHLRNEAHRFAITFHRDLRSKSFIQSELDQIKGIGDSTKEKLLKEYGSTKKIKRASLEELALFIGKSKANLIYNYFND
ncbi:MAG: excinuclease ABC subunit UvrC [Chitinophagales bacterium]|nr:excinuclease ABC subunit C [Chitinophagales bacterium]